MPTNNYHKILAEIPPHVQLIAVSKFRETEAILDIYNQGQRAFAENRVQALLERKESLPSDIKWHIIGHLQTNKVKYIIDFIEMIQSVDSQKLLETINKEAEKANRIIPILLQIKIAQEESKFGFDFKELENLLSAQPYHNYKHVKICGVMGMSTLTDEMKVVESEFVLLKSYFDKLKSIYFSDSSGFKEISMGMSGDYKLAIKNGSTMVRIGSALF